MNTTKREKKAKESNEETPILDGKISPIGQIESFFKDTEGYYGSVYEHVDNGFETDIKIPTGSYKLDMHLDGGYNAGSMSMFVGDRESGKTAQGLLWGKNWQDHFEEKGWVVFYDAEGRLTEKKIRMSGIDKDRLIVVKSNAAEFVLQNIQNQINANPNGFKYFFIVDSINALTTGDERGKTLDEAEARAGVARVTSMSFKKLSLPIHVKGHHLYICSQIRAGNMTGFGGAGNKAGGGKAPEFYGDLIAHMGQAWEKNAPKLIKDGETIIGRYTEIDFRKSYNEVTGSKLAIPVKYNHVGGVWKANEIVDMALEWGLVLKGGSWFNIQGELFKDSAEKAGINTDLLSKKVQGHFGFVGFLEENPDLAQLIYRYILELIK